MGAASELDEAPDDPIDEAEDDEFSAQGAGGVTWEGRKLKGVSRRPR